MKNGMGSVPTSRLVPGFKPIWRLVRLSQIQMVNRLSICAYSQRFIPGQYTTRSTQHTKCEH